MVWPHRAFIKRDLVDLRAEPREDAELIDQAHFGETVRVLGSRGDWRFLQGEDHYLGWAQTGADGELSNYGEAYYVGVLLADVRSAPDLSSPVIGTLPAGTHLPPIKASIEERSGSFREIGFTHPPGWREIPGLRPRGGFVSINDLIDIREIPHRYPTPADLLTTAEAFIGVPYLWGGTTALGLDCSGFVQQVYRLNGVALPRDADQQAMLGQRVEEARAGDLLFFGAESVTHVALATSATEFVHAPVKGGVVERGGLGGDRKLRGIRRYLPEGATP